ncbi:MAG: class F sortase [Frankiaceae bacterium]|jgi:hypothetical protein|nr:class F sortase [Frankiaceae bacterium]
MTKPRRAAGWRTGRGLMLLTALLAMVSVAAAAGIVMQRGAGRGAAAANSPSAPIADPGPVLAQAEAISESPAPPPPPHDPVASTAPTGFEITGPAFTISATVCQMANIRPLDPPGDQYHTVCWVREGFGVAPGSDSGGTSYILGHAWAEAPLVLNPMSETAMGQAVTVAPTMLDGVPVRMLDVLNGYIVTLQLPGGTLSYTVTDAYTVAKSQAGSVASLMDESTPNRIVLITCAVHDGRDVEDNVIVEATLTSSIAA